jgi:glutamine cyclotransferase
MKMILTMSKSVSTIAAIAFALIGPSLGPTVYSQDSIVRYGYEIVNTYPHNINSFTQGLIYHEGFLFEGTGEHGKSSLSKINIEDGEALMSTPLSRRYFGEGVEIVGDKVFQLTWQGNIVFVYDKNTLESIGSHYNATEGWGLAYDGEDLILSDGTATLQFMDAETFAPKRKVAVTLNGNPINYLNELEYINGEVWANVWQTDFIVRIDPSTGVVNSFIDLAGLSEKTSLGGDANGAVLNGIAWDDSGQRLFVTGKNWSNLFEIILVKP